MRALRLVFERRDGMARVLVAATMLPLSAGCGGKSTSAVGEPGNAGTSGVPSDRGGGPGVGGNSVSTSDIGGTMTVGGTSTATTTGGSTSASGGTTSTTGVVIGSGGTSIACPNWSGQEILTIPVPDGAMVADAAAECAWQGTFASDAPATTVTLTEDPNSSTRAKASITIDPSILAQVGYRTVNIVDDNNQATFSNRRATDQGIEFDVEWVSGAAPYLAQSLAIRTTLVYACAPEMSSVREVTTTTHLTLCGSNAERRWVKGGATCEICYPMAEMVALPLPTPSQRVDGLPLPGELELAIRPIAREGRHIVLLVAKEANDQPRLSWHSSAGQLRVVADDVAIWTLPESPGSHQVQVVAETDLLAAIATYLHREDV